MPRLGARNVSIFSAARNVRGSPLSTNRAHSIGQLDGRTGVPCGPGRRLPPFPVNWKSCVRLAFAGGGPVKLTLKS
ncbi:Uncharacterised protein [Mycobacteroides abscessus]|nr:Uncharacterised protein [Mycobacteroides abscessus]